jgi:hypothetical protein
VRDRGRFSSITGIIGLSLVIQGAALSAQSATSTSYDRVILGGHVMDPASGLDAVRNIGLLDGRIAAITWPAETRSTRAGSSSLPGSSTFIRMGRRQRRTGSSRWMA